MAELPLQEADRVISGMEWETTVLIEDALSDASTMARHQNSRAIRQYRPEWRAIRNKKSTHVFLENGGLVYEDVGDRLEYSSPEEDSVTGAVKREYDAEWFVSLMMKNVVADPNNSIELAEVYKRTFSSGRSLMRHDDGSITTEQLRDAESCGYHVNTGLPYVEGRTGISKSFLLAAGLHASTRMLYLGAGVVAPGTEPDPKGFFSLSQRAPFIMQDYSSSTTVCRPVISNRDEPLVSQRFGRWVRHHDINNDPVMSPWALRMIYGTNRLVLRLGLAGIEMTEHQPAADFPLHKIFRQTSFDMTHQKAVDLESGSIKPVDIQRLLYENCLELKGRYELDSDELWTMEQWDKALDDFEKNPLLLHDRTDWIAKKRNLDKTKAKQNIPEEDWTDPRLEVIDQSFTRLGDDTSRGAIMRDKVWNKWLPAGIIDRTDEDRRTPPQTTRAVVRGEFVKRHGTLPGEHNPEGLQVDWSHVKVLDNYYYLAPFDTDVDKLEGWLSADHPENPRMEQVPEPDDQWIGI
jgi:hypothetical protein